MGKRKKSPGGFIFLVGIGCFVYLLANYGKAILVIGGVIAGIWIIYKLFSSSSVPKPPSSGPGEKAAATVRIALSPDSTFEGHYALSRNGDDFWKPAAQTSRVAGFEIGGMLYVGRGLSSISQGGLEPALIDPKLSVASGVEECSVRRLSYWPTYSGASPEARAGYLRWLSSGRSDPNADIGYVFLYFYGLERRALHDAKSSNQAKAEIPEILRETERLLSIYRNNGSFQGYAGSFLDLLHGQNLTEKLYEKEPPPILNGRYMTLLHRLGLAQCAADGKPLPAPWAYCWVMGDPTTRLRTPAVRCPEEFKRAFFLHYREEYKDGLILPQNRTRLKLEHQPASPSFTSGRDLSLIFDLPDVSALSAPVKKLQKIADESYPEVEAYSRCIGKDGSRSGSFEAVLELPLFLWPEGYRQKIEKIGERVLNANACFPVTFGKLQSLFPGWNTVTRQKLQGFNRALSEAGIGVEPDIRFGGKMPTAESTVMLFHDDKKSAIQSVSIGYAAAALTMQFAVAVAAADGAVTEGEEDHLTQKLQDWLDLSESERRRLWACMRLLIAVPPKLTGYKKRLQDLDSVSRERLADFLVHIAQADEVVNTAEMKTIEKVFGLLGLDKKTAYSKVHIAATEPVTVRPGQDAHAGFPIPRPTRADTRVLLDPAKVAALKADSERVASILSSIFYEDSGQSEPTAPTPEPETAEELSDPPIMGLDLEHSAFLRVLLGSTTWSRPDLEDLAQDRGLMLDGAMERMNDTAYELYGRPLFEGEDPVELNPEVVREVLK
ncbi:MAG: TerB N-terminal domain-containing protein [Thermodesulfobacteriota bacterium]